MRRITGATAILLAGMITLGTLSLALALPAEAAPTTSSPQGGPAATPAPVPSPALSAGAGIGIRLLDIPATSVGDPRARTYIVDNLAPGTTVERRVLLRNDTDITQNVRVYAGGARVSGGSFSGSAGKRQNELSRWITASIETMEIGPHSSETATITIAVPSTATSGERFGAIWAEVAGEATDGNGATVRSVNRVGIRVYLSVGPGNGPQTTFTVTDMHAHRAADDRAIITAIVTNTGGRAIDIKGNLSLRDGPDSLRAGPFPLAHVVTLAKGQSGTVSLPLSKGLPRGPWTAKITAKSGIVTESLTARITFPRVGSQHSTAAVIQPPNWWVLIPVILILILIPPAAALSRRRRRARNLARLSQPAPTVG
jgi:hypothetical protein